MESKFFSPDEIRDMKDAFDLIDRDESGGISFDELRRVMFALGINLPKESMLHLFNETDKNKDNELQFLEFLDLMSRRITEGKLTPEEEITGAFRLFDLNKDGMISSSELRTIVENLGLNMPENEIDLIIADADSNKDGKIDLQEFIRYMLQ